MFFSEQFFIMFIIYFSLAMVGASATILSVLVVRRARFAKQTELSKTKRETLNKYFHVALRSPIELTPASLPILSTHEFPIVVDIALDLLRTIKGNDTQKIAGLIHNWGFQDYLDLTMSTGRRGARIKALTLMSYLDSPASLELIVRHSTEQDPYVQMAALRGLASRSSGEAVVQAINSLVRSKQMNAPMLADVLRQFGEPAVSALHKLAQSKSDVRVRLAAITALGNIGSIKSVKTLCLLLDKNDPAIRSHATSALGEIGDVRATQAIARKCDDPDVSVRVAATKALKFMDIKSVVPQLIDRLDDDDWWVRFYSADCLGSAGEYGMAILKSVSALDNRSGNIAAQVLAEQAN